MSAIQIQGNASGTGTVTVAAPNTNSSYTFTLPTETGTALTTNAPGYTGFKNRIINGAMMIDQRNAGAEVNPAVATTYYLDRWLVGSGAASKFKIGQNAGAVTPPAGYINYLGCTSLSAYTPGASESFGVIQRIEGLNVADLAWGTASAATVTLSFWVYSSLTGTFGGSIRNSANTRSYPFTYTVSSANTWTQASITIPGDTTGTWLTTNGVGIAINFSLGAGSTLLGPAGAWAAVNYASVTGSVAVVGTNAATWYITGVQLEKGSTATSFDVRDYGRELILCQRYCFVPSSTSRYVGQCDSTTRALIFYTFPVTMRSGPSATLASASTYNVTTATGSTIAGTAVALSGGFTDSAQLAITVASGLAAGNASFVTANGTTIFSAEL